MVSFIRPQIARLNAYKPNPGGAPRGTIIDHLDANESPYDLPDELKQKLADIYVHQMDSNRYPDGSHDRLKRAIAEYATASATLEEQLSSDRISVGNGSDELIRSVLMATCVGEKASVLVASPTFSMYGILAQTLGIPVITVERDPESFAINPEVVQQAIASETAMPVRVIFVVHPNSPTANPLTPAEIDGLKQLPPDILVVIDEAYFEFSQQTLLAELENYPNWLILRTFSKAFRLASHRVGYALGHPEVISALEKVRLPYNLPSLSQTAAEFVLHHRQAILAVIPELLQERDKLFSALQELSQLRVWPSGANFLYARLQDEADNGYKNLCDRLKEKGTLIRNTGGGLRITVGSPEENQRTRDRLIELL
ncbi:histidinol-phosphate transaminase [Roseofilum casamattae]|uniref:Histidinol-phosphate aminotransferase n=1 Tax=Roseofilum casamattae BLCC-M143 TaxID=3022442 RepID=A0ABT7BVJ0_9CYAN|nr:histidinol-phosphate transaminase [Roseofilum casamattae]MDJ1183210.1 histidinol-phosphate transaminase [Roseofilum casamattae BLCC-M143]